MAIQFSQTTRSLRQDSSLLVLAGWALATVTFAVWLAWFWRGEVTLYEVSQRARLEVQQAPGSVNAAVAGSIVAMSLQVGTDVHAGDPLLILDDSSPRLALIEARQRMIAIPAQMAALDREIAARAAERVSDQRSSVAAADVAASRQREAAAAAEFAREYDQRIRQLSAAGLAAPVDVARSTSDARKADAARESLQAEERRLELDAQTRVSQHDATIESLRHSRSALDGDLAVARATVARLTSDLQRFVVRAPVSGRLGNVAALRPGTFVVQGQQIATIIPSGTVMLVADFDPARAIGRIREGQTAQVRLDGFPWAQFGTIGATVSHVASESRDGFVRVEFALDRPANSGIRLEHGQPGSVDVTVEHTSPASLVLRSAGLLLSGTPAAAASGTGTDAAPGTAR